MKHYLVVESEDKEVLKQIRRQSHLVAKAYPEANIADMLYPGDITDYYFQYGLPPGALAEDREEIAAIFRSFADYAVQTAKRAKNVAN